MDTPNIILRIVVLGVFISANAFAQQQQWEWLNPALNGNFFHSSRIIPRDETIVIGTDNGFVYSRDRGLLWQHAAEGHTVAGVFSPSPDLSFVTTLEGEVYKNAFDAEPELVFEIDNPDAQYGARFNQLVIDPQTGIGLAAGEYETLTPSGPNFQVHYWGIIIRTTDFGDNWDVVYEEDNDKLRDVIKAGDKFFAYGYNKPNFVLESSDGIDWTLIEEFGLGGSAIKKMEFVDNETGFVIYESDNILYHTTDGGETWELRKTFETLLESLTASGTTVAVNTFNKQFISYDLGETWTTLNLGLIGETITMSDNVDDLVLAVGQSGSVFLARDETHNFYTINNHLEAQYHFPNEYYSGGSGHVIMASSNVGYYGMNSKLLKTTDGGCTWAPVQSYPVATSAAFMHGFIDENTGFISGLKTTDGGNTYTPMTFHGTFYGFTSMTFGSTNVGFAYGGQNYIWKTTDAGLNWTSKQVLFNYGTSASFYAVDQSNVFGGSDNDVVLRTNNAGDSWTTSTTGFALDWKGVHYFNSQHGLMVGWETFLKVENGSTKDFLLKP